MFLLDGLRLVGWPLSLAGIVEAAKAARRKAPVSVAARSVSGAPRSALMRSANLACIVVLAACSISVFVYVFLTFLWHAIDPVGKSVVTIARWWAEGQNMYPDATTLDRYGWFPFGPLMFQIVGVPLKVFGPSVLASKAPSAIAFVASTGGMYWVLRRRGVGIGTGLVLAQLLVIVEGTLCVWVRPDPFLIALAVACCCVTTLAPARGQMGLVAVSVLGGLMMAFKLHGILYVFPALAEFLTLDWRKTATRLAGFSVISLAVSFAPFLVPGASLANYEFSLSSSLEHDGLYLGIFISNIFFISTFVLALHVLSQGARTAGYYRNMASVMGSACLVSVVAAKAGSGPHHLIPLLPYLIVSLGDVLRSQPAAADDRPRQGSQLLLFAVMLVTFQPVSDTFHHIRQMYAAPPGAIVADARR